MRTREHLTRHADDGGAVLAPPAGGVQPRGMALALAGPVGPPTRRIATMVALLVGAALVAASGLIHLYLWADGYQRVPTIGPLFVAQGITGLAIAVLLVAYPRVLIGVVGAGYLLASIVALVLSASRGFLGFMDSFDAPWAVTSLVIESAGAVTLLVGAALPLSRD